MKLEPFAVYVCKNIVKCRKFSNKEEKTAHFYQIILKCILATVAPPIFRLYTVEVQGSTASLYGQTGTARLAFLIKLADGGGLSIEGRSGDRELLAGLLEEMANQLA